MDEIERGQELSKPKIILRKPPWILAPLKFVNTREFSKEGLKFLRDGKYTDEEPGTIPYLEYWAEQYKRCKEGYTVGGVTITGRHYFYLNFIQIEATEGEGHSRKKLTFPRFLDMDYYYFHEVDNAIKEGKGLCVLKSRRKGFSYKNSALCVYEYTFEVKSRSIIGAYLDEYAFSTFSMAATMLNFLNGSTEFGQKSQKHNTKTFRRASYFDTETGVDVEMGSLSEIMALTFNKNTSAAIGKSSSLFLFEEAGKWPGLETAYGFTYPTFKSGLNSVAFWVVFGTGGDMTSGATKDFEKMFYQPENFDLVAYENLYEESQVREAGLFIDDAWYMEPFVDDRGYSDRIRAVASNRERLNKIKEKAKSMDEVESHMTQFPLIPSEAFYVTSGAYFPQHIIRAQLNRIRSDKRLQSIGQNVILEESSDGKIKQVPSDMLFQAPFPFEAGKTEGCITIYEPPEEINGTVPAGLYLASMDPYQQDSADTTSLGSTFIYKKFLSLDKTHNIIVAEYTGRPDSTSTYYDNVIKLLKYYNAVCLFENEVPGPKPYFENKNLLHLLAYQPDHTIKAITPNSTVRRHYGVHMRDQLKSAAIVWLKEWLKEEKSPGYYNVNDIFSEFLLTELLKFDNKGNFDRVSSLLVMMIHLQEETRSVVEESVSVKNVDFFEKFARQTGWTDEFMAFRRTRTNI